MIAYPEIDPVAIALGPVKVHWYGLTYVVGFFAAWLLLRYRAARSPGGWSAAMVDDIIFYGMVGVLLGGRVGYLLFYGLSNIATDPLYPFKIWQGGMSFHGGLLGVILAMMLIARKFARPWLAVTDLVAPIVPLGLFTGRIGNFVNGELWGGPSQLPWAFIVNGQGRHPSQLYEAALEGVVLFVLLLMYASRPRALGAVSGAFLLGYGMFRCAVEFVRVPDEHIGYLAFDWLTMGHVLSTPMILIGVWLIASASRRGMHTAAVTGK